MEDIKRGLTVVNLELLQETFPDLEWVKQPHGYSSSYSYRPFNYHIVFEYTCDAHGFWNYDFYFTMTYDICSGRMTLQETDTDFFDLVHIAKFMFLRLRNGLNNVCS